MVTATSQPRSTGDRRNELTDAGLDLVAKEGMRGLTHRAVDRAAGMPDGTCSNYFRTRAALVEALADRLFDRLLPDQAVLEAEVTAPPSREQWVKLMVDLVDRARAQPALHVALWELRLEATRRPELVPALTGVVNRNYEFDLSFHRRTGLPGGPEEIRLLHLALNGLILELITLPDALGPIDVEATVADVVDRLVYRR